MERKCIKIEAESREGFTPVVTVTISTAMAFSSNVELRGSSSPILDLKGSLFNAGKVFI